MAKMKKFILGRGGFLGIIDILPKILYQQKAIKGTDKSDFLGLFWFAWIWSGLETNLYWFFNFSVTSFLQPIKSFEAFHAKMDLQMWAAVLGYFLFSSCRTVGKV